MTSSLYYQRDSPTVADYTETRLLLSDFGIVYDTMPTFLTLTALYQWRSRQIDKAMYCRRRNESAFQYTGRESHV